MNKNTTSNKALKNMGRIAIMKAITEMSIASSTSGVNEILYIGPALSEPQSVETTDMQGSGAGARTVAILLTLCGIGIVFVVLTIYAQKYRRRHGRSGNLSSARRRPRKKKAAANKSGQATEEEVQVGPEPIRKKVTFEEDLFESPTIEESVDSTGSGNRTPASDVSLQEFTPLPRSCDLSVIMEASCEGTVTSMAQSSDFCGSL